MDTKTWQLRANIIICSVLGVAAFLADAFAAWWTRIPCSKMAAAVAEKPATCLERHFDTARIALVWAAPITSGLLILIAFIFQGSAHDGIVGFIRGKDNQLSTSKTQVALWTIAIVFAFIFFTIQVIRAGSSSTVTSGFSHFGPEYLLLLGGPFAAAVLATATTANKADSGKLQQIQAKTPSPSDLVTDTTGEPSLSDTQYLLFNLVALTYFAVALARAPTTLPHLPDTLVALTSVSALAYLGAKVASPNIPTITTVSITSSPSNGLLHAGDTVRIIGSGFDPAAKTNATGEDIRVLFNGVSAAPIGTPSDTLLQAKVPRGLTATETTAASISVQSSAGLVTPTPFMRLSIEGPRITSLMLKGSTVFVSGYGLGLDLQPTVSVRDGNNSTVTASQPEAVVAGEAGAFKFKLTNLASSVPPYTVTVTVNTVSSSEPVS